MATPPLGIAKFEPLTPEAPAPLGIAAFEPLAPPSVPAPMQSPADAERFEPRAAQIPQIIGYRLPPAQPDLAAAVNANLPDAPDPAQQWKAITAGTPQAKETTAQIIDNLKRLPILGAEFAGTQQLAKGLMTLGDPARLARVAHNYRQNGPVPVQDEETKNAISDVIEGGFNILTPILATSALMAPLKTAIYLGSAITAQKLAHRAVLEAGGDESTARLVSNVAAFSAGAALEAGRLGVFLGAKKIVEATAPEKPTVIAPDAADIDVQPTRPIAGVLPENTPPVELGQPAAPEPTAPLPAPVEPETPPAPPAAPITEPPAPLVAEGANTPEANAPIPTPLAIAKVEPLSETAPEAVSDAWTAWKRRLDLASKSTFAQHPDWSVARVSAAAYEFAGPEPEKYATDAPRSGTVGQAAVSSADDLGTRSKVVDQPVLARGVNREVLDSVVGSIPVDVVNVLGGQQRTSEMLLHDPAVLVDVLSANLDGDVAPFVQSLLSVVASRRAELSRADLTRGSAEHRATLDALDGNLREALALATRPKPSPSVLPSDELSETTSGAEPPIAEPDLVGTHSEESTAELAPPVDDGSHSEILPPKPAGFQVGDRAWDMLGARNATITEIHKDGTFTLQDDKGRTFSATKRGLKPPKETAPATSPAQEPAPPATIHIRRELGRMATELEEGPFTPRTFIEAGPGRGGDLDVIPGAAGAPVFHDILQAAPGTAGYSRAQVARALRTYLKTGKVTNPVRGALKVAAARLAGEPALDGQPLSRTSWGVDAGNEPGQIYVDRNRHLSSAQQEIQERAADMVESDPAGMIAAYRQRFPDVIGSDNAKELFPDYAESKAAKTATSLAVHRASQALAQAVYEQVVAEPTPEGKTPTVVFTAGGTGSGKTTGLDRAIPGARAIAHTVYDSTLTDPGLAFRNIDLALEHGKDVTIAYVFRPIDKAFLGTLSRAMDMGRPISLDAHIRTHLRALDTIQKIHERYGDNVDIVVIDNSGGPDDVKMSSLEELAKVHYNEPDVRQALSDILDAEVAAGRVSNAVEAATRVAKSDADSDRARPLDGEEPPQSAEVADTLDTGETQPRLPEAGAVRDAEVPTPEFDAPFSLTPEAPKPTGVQHDLLKGGGGNASNVGAFDESEPARSAPIPKPDDRRLFPGTPTDTANTAQPVQFPELVELARRLQGIPKVVKAFRTPGKLGEFSERGIKLTAELFKPGNEYQLAATLAHEIGHLVDFLPHHTLKRGNLLGRLFSLKSFLKHTFTAMDGATIKNKDVRAELMALSDKWRPWDPAKASPSFKQYRHSGKELYADALSVLLNNPGLLEREAPVFYKQFFAALDDKPEVKAAYFDLQEVLAGTPAELVARRRQGVRRMFEEGDVAALELEKRRQAEAAAQRKDLWLRMKVQLVDKNYAVIDKVTALRKAGTPLADDENPLYLLEERNYIGGKLKGFVEEHFVPVYTALDEADIAWNAFSEALFYERIIAGDRSEVANPRGLSPTVAGEMYDSLKRELGPAKVRALTTEIAHFRKALKTVADAAYEEGLYSPELYKQMQENPAYVTFQVIEHLESAVTSRVYKQVGTLKDIVNTADASILKALVTIRATEHNKVKRLTFDMLEQHFPTSVSPAKTIWTGKGHKPVASKDPRQTLVTYYEHGTLVGKYVDPYIASSLENESVGANFALVTIMRTVNSGVFRPLFTTFNLGFQSYNFIRDFERFWKNSPKWSITHALARYWQAIPMAKVRAWGLPDDPTAKEVEAYRDLLKAEQSKILGVTFNDLNKQREVGDTQIEDILRRTGVGGFQPRKRRAIIKPFVRVLDFIKELGDFIETLPKAAALYEYKGTGSIAEIPASTRSFIRRKIGSPDFLAGGTWKPVTNEFLLFSNVATQSLRSDAQVATDPKTRAGWWWKTAAVVFLPKLLMFAALFGLMGETIRRLMQRTTEYDRTNYLVIPLGEDHEGNTLYIRLPQDDTSRLLGGIFWKVLRGLHGDKAVAQSLAQVVDYTAGQFPGLSPALSALSATAQFVEGQNPYDTFRGRNVFTDDEWKARDYRTVQKFIGWEFQQLGGGIVWKFYAGEQRPKAETRGQQILELPVVSNLVARFVRITNYGEQEAFTEVKQQVEQGEARHRLDEQTAVNKAVRALKLLPKDKQPGARWAAARTIAEAVYADESKAGRAQRTSDIAKKIEMGEVRSGADALTSSVMSAQSTDQKVAIIAAARRTMSDTEMQAWMREALRTKVISENVYGAAQRQKARALTTGGVK